MSREIKRVPLTFDWPLDKTWEGYINPFYVLCEACLQGQTWAGWWLQKICYLLSMMADASVSDEPMHPWLYEFPMAPYELRPEMKALYPSGSGKMPPREAYELMRPTPDMAALFDGITKIVHEGKPHTLFNSRSQDEYKVYRALVRASKVKDFGHCKACDGTGIKPEFQKQHEAWRRTDPPEGDGWQVWQTVGEGSPITPVFPTAETLVDYLSTYGTIWDQERATRGSSMPSGPWRREAAEAFVKMGSSIGSMVGIPGKGLLDGARDIDKIMEPAQG